MSYYDDIFNIDRPNRKVTTLTIEEFVDNVKKNPNKYINYCEAIINKDGMIGDARPSHNKALMGELGLSDNKANDMLPEEYYFNVMGWLIDKSGCVAVYYNGFRKPSYGLTKEQTRALKILEDENVIDTDYKYNDYSMY